MDGTTTPTPTEFEALCSAALAGTQAGDMLPVWAACDYLTERGDGRGERLRRRAASLVRYWAGNVPWVQAVRERWPGFADMAREVVETDRRGTLLSYFIRLTGTPDGDPLPRRAVSNCYPVVGPAG